MNLSEYMNIEYSFGSQFFFRVAERKFGGFRSQFYYSKKPHIELYLSWFDGFSMI